MANTLRFKRGLAAGIPTGVAGEPLFTTDTFDLYIGNGTTNTRFQKYIASGTTSQLLRGDGSLLTMPIVLTSPANGEVLKYNGTNWVNSSDAGITGSGLAGQVAYFTGATTQAGSNNLFYTSNILTITHPTGGLPFIVNNGATTGTIESLRVRDNTASQQTYSLLIGTGQIIHRATWLGGTGVNMNHVWANATSAGAVNNNMTLYSTGNLGINTSSDSGQRLQVTGTALITGATTIGGNLAVDTNVLFVDATNNRVGVGTASPTLPLTIYNPTANTNAVEIRGGGGSSQSRLLFTYGSDTTKTDDNALILTNTSAFLISVAGSRSIILNTNSLDRATLDSSGNLGLHVTPSAWGAAFKAMQIGSRTSIFTESDLASVISNNYVFTDTRRYLASGYATAYEQVFGEHRWKIAPSGTAGNAITFTQAMTLDAASNLLLGSTTSSGERLQVTGTAKITGASVFGGANYDIATFQSSNAIGGYITFKRSGIDYLFIGNSTAVGGGANNVDIFATTGNGIRLFANGLVGLSIATTGAATFSSSVTAGGNMLIQKSQPQIQLYQTGADHNYSILGNTNTALEFWHGTFGSNTTKMLSLAASTGAATFNSSVTAGGNLLLTNGTAASIGAINLIRTGTSPVASRMTFGTDDTGYSFAIAKNVTGTVTDLVTIADSGAATFSSSIQAASATITGNLTVDSSTLFVDATANEVGIGTNAPNSSLQVVGSVSKSISDVKTANYTATATDHTILCSAASGGFTITLPASSGITGRIYVIKKTNASSGVNSVTVDGNGAETIDGSASINLACKSSVMLQCDGSNWHILSLYSDSSCL